jgi:hypothetical protein
MCKTMVERNIEVRAIDNTSIVICVLLLTASIKTLLHREAIKTKNSKRMLRKSLGKTFPLDSVFLSRPFHTECT